MRTGRFFAALAGALLLAAPAAAQEIVGAWEGVLETPNAKLRLVLEVTPAPEGLPDAVLVSLDQGDAEIPGKVMTFEKGKAEVLFIAVGGAYTGQVSPDGKTMTGTWSQGSASLPLNMTRKAQAAKQP